MEQPKCPRLVYDLTNPGQLTKIETDEHSFAWSGKMPCTGEYRCVFCGYAQPDKQRQIK